MSNSKTKVLYVLHNHPALMPGGAEGYALELYKAMREVDAIDPLLVARIGSNVALRRASHPGAPFSMVDGDPSQYLLFTETEHFDFFHLTSRAFCSERVAQWAKSNSVLSMCDLLGS